MCSARLVFRKKRRVPLSGSDSDAIRPWTNWMRRRPKSMRRRTGNRDAKMTKVTFISADGQNRMVVDAHAGENLLDIAQANGQPLEGTFEGQIACFTCHVVVDSDYFARHREGVVCGNSVS